MTQATLTDRPDDCECKRFPSSNSTLECFACRLNGNDGINPNASTWEPEESA